MEGSSDGLAASVCAPLDGCVSLTPFVLSAVAFARTHSSGWLFLLLWAWRWTSVGSSGAVPRGNYWGSHVDGVFSVFSLDQVLLTSSLSSPGRSRPGLSWLPHGFRLRRFGRLVLLAPWSLTPPSRSTPFARFATFWRLCDANWVPPLFSSPGGTSWLGPSGLAIFASITLVSRPWTVLRWSPLRSLSSVSDHLLVVLRQLVSLRSILPLRPFALLLTLGSNVPSGSLLRYRGESSRWGHPAGSGLSQFSIGTRALTTPFWCLVGAFAMGSPFWAEFFLRSRSERRLLGHLP